MAVSVRLFFMTIQLVGSPPSVSSFAWYSGVFIVMILLGAVLEAAGVEEFPVATGAIDGFGAGEFTGRADGDAEGFDCPF